jgi:glycosyltransferase involved in cell wall biosynthesis
VTSASLQTRFGSYHPSVDGAGTTHVPNSVDVTVILPCYNEEAHFALEIERISAALDRSGLSYELLVIDDKSTDNTLDVVKSELPRYPHLRLMPFRRNGG